MVLVVCAMAAMVFYIFAIAVGNFIVRKGAIGRGEISPGYFKTFDNGGVKLPEFVVRCGRHYDNQFEVPMLFLMTCTVGMHLAGGSLLLGVLAWAFVLSRVIHTYIHLGSNNILLRAQAYGVGLLCILGMWLVILAALFM